MNFADQIKNLHFQPFNNNTSSEIKKEMEFINKNILVSGIKYVKENLLSDANISFVDKTYITSILDSFNNVINEIPSIKVTLNLPKDEEKQDD